MKILLFGKNGQLGWELQRSLSPLGELLALGSNDHTPWCGNLMQLQALADTVRAVRPDVIVNAAAYTAVDRAEREPELAHALNAAAPGVLAQEAQRLGAWMVHYSTDYVFNGQGHTPWTEADAPAPLNVYGHTKWAGEQQVAAHAQKHLIFRTSWVYAARGHNFMRTMLRLAQEREQLSVVNDQWGAPTGAELLADISAHAIRTVTAVTSTAGGGLERAGTYHLVADGHTTWHAYAQTVLHTAQRLGLALKLQPADIAGIPSTGYPVPAQRPLNSRLNTQKLRHAFGLQLPAWPHGVERALLEMLPSPSLSASCP